MNKFFLFGVAIFTLLSACKDQEVTEKVIGLKPVYGSEDDLSSLIKTSEDQPLKSVGKIYVYQNKLLINEVGEGVHIFDNTDPANPVNEKFISIPGNVDVAIKNNYMYADMGIGLVTIDIANLDNVQVTHFDQEYVGEKDNSVPPTAILSQLITDRVYYECPDKSKGFILKWEQAEMPKPECYIIQ